MLRSASAVACLLLSCACSVPSLVESLDDRSPPPDFGRAGWVRGVAKVGAWIGAVPGTVASGVLLPVTWPLSLAVEDGIDGGSADELLLFPMLACASVGHSLFALPCDAVDYFGRRVWSAPSPLPSRDQEVLDAAAAADRASAGQPVEQAVTPTTPAAPTEANQPPQPGAPAAAPAAATSGN
ncbi:MAG: hypothetical protein ACK5AL_04145 [Planctomycetota bacterium]